MRRAGLGALLAAMPRVVTGDANAQGGNAKSKNDSWTSQSNKSTSRPKNGQDSPQGGQQDSNGGDANAYGGDAKAGNGSDATQSNASYPTNHAGLTARPTRWGPHQKRPPPNGYVNRNRKAEPASQPEEMIKVMYP